MKTILLLSDTHGYLDDTILKHAQQCDEIWHAGDWGTIEVSDKLSEITKLRGVYGNIDGDIIRKVHPLHNRFKCEEVDVWITHIAGYPGKYNPNIRQAVHDNPPDLLIAGHSHILKVMRDPRLNNMLFINPGATGIKGFHKKRTMVRFKIDGKRIYDMAVIELKHTPRV